jgi:hypothetical protein
MANAVVETTELATREQTGSDLQQTQAAAFARYEMEGALLVARRFPRNEDAAFQKLMKSCGRATFAADAAYSFPRGGEQITGPSVYLAKEAARVWGNIRYGADIIADDEQNRHIRGWAWDVETNSRTSADDYFAKLVFRKKGGWIKPDERDLRELTNRRAAILVRNCILSLLPTDLVEDALAAAGRTIEKGVGDNIDEHRKKVLTAFGSLGVSVEDLESFLQHKIGQATPAEIANLRKIWKSITDGNSTWAEYAQGAASPAETTGPGPVSMDDLTKPKEAAVETSHEEQGQGPSDPPAAETTGALGDGTAADSGKPIQPPAGAAEDPTALDGLSDALAECEKLSDLMAVIQQYSSRGPLSEAQKAALDASAKARKEQLGAKKKKPASDKLFNDQAYPSP